jgi:hypothetical protein
LALTPHQTDALLREVDDAVRQDDVANFWRNYGRAVVGAVIVGLAAFGGWLLWQSHSASVAEENSVQFSNLLKSAQGGSLDKTIYDKVVADGGPGYKAEAELVKAALAAGRDETKEAVASYDAVLADPKALPPMKDAALLRKTVATFDSLKPDQVVAALKGLAVPGNPWFGSAGELSAVAYLKMGRRDLAGELYASLARDANVPDSIKLRAAQMASMMGSLPTTPAAAAPVPVPTAPAQ